MLALRFYASGSFMEVIGDTMGFDKSTVSRAINNVTNALVLHKDKFIKWPNPAETPESKQNFFLRGGFPGVIGCVDGTHVRIQAPWGSLWVHFEFAFKKFTSSLGLLGVRSGSARGPLWLC